MSRLRVRFTPRMAAIFAGALFAAWFGIAGAKEAASLAEDEAVEQRMASIAGELRCLVCQNESLAGSHAELAQDLRRQIREMIHEKKSDREILDFMVDRYGDFVRYRPPMNATTALLWFGPFLLLIAGAFGLFTYLRRRARNNRTDGTGELTPQEKQQAEALLRQADKQDSR